MQDKIETTSLRQGAYALGRGPLIAGQIMLCLFLLAAPLVFATPALAQAETPITTMTLGSDQIGFIRTAQEITTRISFPEIVREIICGDLYDGATGKGSFVVQRSGKDVFLKPIASKGLSNLFVKTGEAKTGHVYNFDLQIVTETQAYRVVNVTAAPEPPGHESTEDPGKAAERKADETLGKARQQAQRILDEAQQQATEIKRAAELKADEINQQAASTAEREIENRFVKAMMLGITEIRTKDEHVSQKKVSLKLDRRILRVGDRSYLRYTIQNSGNDPFSFASIVLEKGAGAAAKPISMEVIQNKKDNSVKPGESITGIIVFNPAAFGPADSLSISIRAKDKTEIAHAVITQTV
ncbi:MAG TPA: hypothetical protein VJX67_11485 [Blastocatellia bacterium]|nr:hypothetical protein [Blastocatellia bacterium]